MANKSINPFHSFKGRSVNQKIALTGIFLGLVILFQYLEQFMPFAGTFVKFNFTLLFILPIFYFAGPIFGFTTLILRFVIGTSMSGWITLHIVGESILFISTTVVIFFMYIYSFAFIRVKNHNLKIVYISVFTVVSASLVLALLNGVWFTPMYFYVMDESTHYGLRNIVDIHNAQIAYQYVKYAHFGISNYWGGIFAVYITANLVKFGIIYVINYPLSKVLRHYLSR